MGRPPRAQRNATWCRAHCCVKGPAALVMYSRMHWQSPSRAVLTRTQAQPAYSVACVVCMQLVCSSPGVGMCSVTHALLALPACLQMVVERASAGDMDIVQHALDLFVDFVAIFVRVLIVLMKNTEQRDRREREKKRRE
jgi:hypothetical protein